MAAIPTIEIVIIGRQKLLDLLSLATAKHCANPRGDAYDVDDVLSHVQDLFEELLDELPTEQVGLTVNCGRLVGTRAGVLLETAPELLDEVRSRQLSPSLPISDEQPPVAEAACDVTEHENRKEAES